MKRRPQKRFWRIARAVFRWCRIWLWLVVLVVVAIAVYFNTIGLPGFLKRPLLAALHDRGWDVQFSNMRWHWYRGLLIDNAQFVPAEKAATNDHTVKFHATEADLNLNFVQWRKSRVGLDGFIIRNGQLTIPAAKNRPELMLTNISTNVRLLPGDRVIVEPLQASFRGANIKISANVTNASALRDLEFFLPREQTNKLAGQKSQRFWELFEQCKFAETPELNISFHGDGAVLERSHAELELITPLADTPWGRLKSMTLEAKLNNGDASQPHATFRIRAANAEGASVRGQNVQIAGQISSLGTNLAELAIDLRFSGNALLVTHTNGQFTTKKVQGSATATLNNTKVISASGKVHASSGSLQFVHGLTNAVQAELQQGALSFAFDHAKTNRHSELTGTIFEKLQPLDLAFDGELKDVTASGLTINRLKCAAQWTNSVVNVEWLDADLYGGRAEASGTVNVITRKASVSASSTFDLHKVTPLLPRVGQRFVAKYTWAKPPHLSGTVIATLPAWTNRRSDWAEDVLSTLKIDGKVEVGAATYRKIEASSAKTSFHFSNYVWRVPDIHVIRPEGELRLGLLSDGRTGAFCWRIDSHISPAAIRHLLDEEQQRGLDKLTFSTPPAVRGEVCGMWNNQERIEFRGNVAITNFSYRDLDLDRVTSAVEFTNKLLRCSDLHVERGNRRIDSPKIEINFETNRVFFTEVESTIDPHRVVKVIGREATEAIAPYRFAEPPYVRMNGALTIGEVDDADLHFEVAGDKFAWEWFRADKAGADVFWKGQQLLVTNVQASAYRGGKFNGWSYFDFSPRGKADYEFAVRFANVDVQSFVSSLGKSNSIEGLLTGDLRIHQADTRGLETWQGKGSLELHDGVIWEIPVFGIFTPVLDAIVPGLGKSRAREAVGQFGITNGVAVSDDFEIRASGFRMQYRGFIDSQQRIEARVMAEILRDTWAIGKVVSLALMPLSKIFEYRVSGTVDDPKTEPVYVPKFLLKTLRPFNTIKKAFSDKPNSSDEASE